MRPKRGLAVAIAGASASAAAIAWGCTSYGALENEAPSIPDAEGPTEGGGGPDSAVDAGLGGETSAFDLEVRPSCPRPRAPAMPCTGAFGQRPCARTQLYIPPSPEHVFGIVADRRHVFWHSQAATPDGGPEAYNGLAEATLRRLDRTTREVVELARAQRAGTVLFARGANLFWGAEEPAGSNRFVVRQLRKDAPGCSPSGCAAPKVLATGLPPVMHIGALTEDRIFVVGTEGSLSAVTLDSPSQAAIGNTTAFPGFAVGEGHVFLSGGFQNEVERYGPTGTQKPGVATLPDGSTAIHLASSCTALFAWTSDNRVLTVEAAAENGVFVLHATLVDPFDVFSIATDAQFLYFGAANGLGLRRVDHTVSDSGAVEMAVGSVWAMAVTDDAVIYGEHGALGPGAADGTIFSIAK